VCGTVATNRARLVDPGEPVEISGPPPRFVGRGGEKLDAALDRFAISVDGRRAVDAGASTGGFTDVLLQRGAERVVAIDVGRNQLHERLRADPRVDSRERTNIRRVTADDVGGVVPLVVADLSFISLRSVADALVGLAADGADLVLLVKPQFEASKGEASKGRGVITDPAVWRRVLGEVCGALRERGAAIMGLMVSPLRGADGNVEFLLHARAHEPIPGPVDDAAIAAVVADAEGPR